MDRLNRWTTRQTEWVSSIDGQMDGGWYQVKRQIGQTVILSDGQTERWMDRPNRQTDGQIDRQINIRADSTAG